MFRSPKKQLTSAPGDSPKVIITWILGLTREDPKLVHGREAAMSVYSKPIVDLGMVQEEHLPDVENQKEFADKVKKEFMTSNYPMYAKLYFLQLVMLIS
jgi:hypothetical protein